ncbi:MAG: response regulator [Armatimonadetes bacterium]|nr:response regulator [Armatimonadota bacterium]
MSKILIVDDSAYVRRKSKQLLVDMGFDVEEAGDGTVALSKYQEWKPDLVLLDITMPEMDGVTAVEELMKLDSKAKIVILTAMAQQSTLFKAVKAGAKEYLLKPLDETQVKEVIERVLSED